MTVIQTKRVYYSLEFLNWLAVALPLPFAVLFMQARGLDLFQMGLLSGIYSVTIVLLELPTGGLADAIGRKPVTLMSYLATLGSSLVFLLSFSLPVFALAWILLGIGRALASGALSAWFVDALLASDPEIDLQPALAQAGTFTILGLSLGTLIGGLIPELFAFLPEEGSAIFTPLAMTIFFAILLKGLNTLLLIVFVRESRPKVKQDAPLSIRSLPMIIKDAFVQTADNPIIKWILLASLVGLLGITSIENLWQPQFSTWLSTENSFVFGVIMSIAFMVGVLGNLVSIPLSKWFGKRYGYLAAFSQVIAGTAIILLALQNTLSIAMGFFWLYYLMVAVLGSPVGAIFNYEVPSERRSSMQSIMSLSGYAGALLGSVVLGWVAETYSITSAWLIAGSLVALASFIYIWIETLRQNKNYKTL